MKQVIIIAILMTASAMASDVGTATKELCASKGMSFVKSSVSKTTGKTRKAFCRKKHTKKAERAVSNVSEPLNIYEQDLDDSERAELGVN